MRQVYNELKKTAISKKASIAIPNKGMANERIVINASHITDIEFELIRKIVNGKYRINIQPKDKYNVTLVIYDVTGFGETLEELVKDEKKWIEGKRIKELPNEIETQQKNKIERLKKVAIYEIMAGIANDVIDNVTDHIKYGTFCKEYYIVIDQFDIVRIEKYCEIKDAKIVNYLSDNNQMFVKLNNEYYANLQKVMESALSR